MDRFERHVLRQLAGRALFASPMGRRGQRANRSVFEWIITHRRELGLTLPACVDEWVGGTDLDEVVGTSVWREAKLHFAPMFKVVRAPEPSALERRLNWLCGALSLSPLDASILKLVARRALSPEVGRLVEALQQNPHTPPDEISLVTIKALVDVRNREMMRNVRGEHRHALSTRAPLMQLGLIEDRCGGDVAPTETVLSIARAPSVQPERLRRMMFGQARKAELAWSDFAHLGEIAELAADLLASALKAKARGVNILLYGPPGTGKTEFARSLAERTKTHMLFAGETADGEEPKRGARISAAAIAQVLAARSGRTAVVIDEADDLFTGVDDDDFASRTGSKVFMNRMVEGAEAPAIWIVNDPERMGAAVLRRMSLAIRFPEPDGAVRRRIGARAAQKRGIRITASELEGLAAIDGPPAVISNGLRVAAMTGRGAVATTALAARSVMRAMGRREKVPAPAAPIAFDPLLSAADQDLATLADRAARSPGRALSFCFFGLPGTGKSAFARHLAGRIGVEVIEKRASDLMSMWVGGTEKLIARAFEEAADRKAMLILDEADSLLRSRALAERSWEVTQVNEMLTAMERAAHPFVCTTNLMHNLDEATLRRFLFKVRFLPMTPDQARGAFRRAFKSEPPAALDRLEPLAPGDFAVVARKAEVLGERAPATLVAMLAAEVEAKPGAGRMAMGFGR